MSGPNGSDRPPTAGAVDLSQLRDLEEHKLNAARHDALRNAGVMCPCGERVRDSGVELVYLVVGLVNTPTGPQAGAGTARQVFHSSECAVLRTVLEQERKKDEPTPVAVQAARPVTWLDEAAHADD